MIKTTENRTASDSGSPDKQPAINIQALGAITVASLFASVAMVGRINCRAILVFLVVFGGLGGC